MDAPTMRSRYTPVSASRLTERCAGYMPASVRNNQLNNGIHQK